MRIQEPEKQINRDLVLREEMALERTKMANYRTLLAFIRTSLYFPVAGISMNHALEISFGSILQWSGIIIGFLILLVGLVFYFRARHKFKFYQSAIGNYPVN